MGKAEAFNLISDMLEFRQFVHTDKAKRLVILLEGTKVVNVPFFECSTELNDGHFRWNVGDMESESRLTLFMGFAVSRLWSRLLGNLRGLVLGRLNQGGRGTINN